MKNWKRVGKEGGGGCRARFTGIRIENSRFTGIKNRLFTNHAPFRVCFNFSPIYTLFQNGRHLVFFVFLQIDLSRILLQCVRTIGPERGWGGHFRRFTVFLSTPTSTRCHCLLECGKGLSALFASFLNSKFKRTFSFYEATRANLQANKRILKSPAFWNKVYSTTQLTCRPF